MEEHMKKQIADILVPALKPVFLIVFGSYAKGHARPDSDLDIAFYCDDAALTSYDVFMLAQQLADKLKMEVDLVNLKEANTVFQAQIFSTGVTIHCIDENIRVREQMKALSMYVKLNEDRWEALEQIARRGSVYD
ncbi:type VII toxin-antitoxin system MntA family adenylyltransferase antitoxin [Psychrobacillus soli]|uniref:Nucleotidyltransferase domain-containing protein n=1 Tax=Psychrobacillus soli TaxID=1543965 RepID=A0A544SQ20_9BACI|nr:nucleotidyltransferase domain-containing protein [Psychrobacillus soli]TQR07291.1 nucleotidyltransferase domain-containing protein [Psychrobacillus soli]